MSLAVPRTFRALRHRNFRLFFIGQGLSVMGTWLQQVAMGWLTYRLSGSVLLLGVVAFCGNFGILAFGTFAGVVADHVHRRRALVVTQSLMLLQAVALAALTWSGHVAVWHLVVLALTLGLLHAFDAPLRQSLWVHLVEDREDLPNVVALNSFLVNAARMIGPALAGLLLAIFSEAVCFALNALSFVAVILAVSRMRWAREPGPVPWEGGFWSKWIEGYRFVAGFAPARALLLLVAVVSWTITPYSSLMPVYAKDIYGGGPEILGFLLAAAGAGALASTVYLAGRATIRGLGRVIAIGATASGLALSAFAYLSFLPLALALMFVVGSGVVLVAASVNTILQTIVPDRLRGRLAGFFLLAFLGIAPLGNLAAGALGDVVGVPATFVVNGLAATTAALWFWRVLPALRALMRPTYLRLGIIPGDA
ncbi:MAG: MFS transporter [Betaproteobacteria bacterium]|nr:MFS transporter [Betaproteobacteria bacterium]